MSHSRNVQPGDLLWTPDPKRVERAHVTAFMRWLHRERGLEFSDYASLWQWSVDELEEFWRAIWDYFGLKSSTPWQEVLVERRMPGAKWFPGVHLNLAENLLGKMPPDEDAYYFLGEDAPLRGVTGRELGSRVRKLAAWMRSVGVQPGDRVASYLPNGEDAIVAVLATASVGAIWSSCSPDFGVRGVLDRLQQIQPKLLLCVDGYTYGGKPFDRREQVKEIISKLPSLERVVYRRHLNPAASDVPRADAVLLEDLLNGPEVPEAEFQFEQVPFDHPLWILFSSGTTGLPKPIVQGHGGILIEQYKLMHFHMDMHPGETIFFFTTTGWMMWNFLVCAPVAGARAVFYDGNPMYPGPEVLWQAADKTGAHMFGASPTYVDGMLQAGIVPRDLYELKNLRSIVLAGSPASPHHTAWFYDNVKEDLWMATGSGGTDVCSGIVGGVATLPVYAGEIQARQLGVAVYAFNEQGEPVVDEVGEMVITLPMPSMPLFFWGDEDGSRYRDSYFDTYPGLWRHGDFFRVNERGGCFVLGRSDATLNRYGVRIGTAEVYRVLGDLPEILDAMVINLDLPGGKFFMPLFVKLQPDAELDDALIQRIRARLRQEYSPRHVPDRILQVEEIPYTLSGKKMEVPVRRILMGRDPATVADPSVMRNPQSLQFYADYARTQTEYPLA